MAASEPTVHDQIAQGLKEHPARKGIRFNILVTAVEVGGSIALFHLAQGMGANDVVSYLMAASLQSSAASWSGRRPANSAEPPPRSSRSPRCRRSSRWAEVTLPGCCSTKDGAVTALIGLIFLGSCVLVRKPVVFYMAQRYGMDGTRDGMAIFDRMWGVYRAFRTSMYVISYLWAALFLIQAAGTALIIRQTRYSTAYSYDQTLPLAATALGIVGSIAIGRYYAKKGKARGATASAVPLAD